MMKSFYQGISGMKSMSEGLAITGNNLANAKTNGYKAREALFQDLFYQSYRASSAENEQFAGINPIEIGNGVRMAGVAIDHTQGNIGYTGRTTDMAISGEGYFVVGDKSGQNNKYTRDGAFELSADNKLVTNGGLYVMGWNIDPFTGLINTGAGVNPIEINLNQFSRPSVTTFSELIGNLNGTAEVGAVTGAQIPSYDSIGSRHDLDFNFIKTGAAPSTYTYVASPANDFIKSASIEKAVFQPSLGIAGQLQKGAYEMSTSLNADGTVRITLTDPSGTDILTKNISNNDQTVSLDDGTNQWFTIEYKKGGAPSSAYFQIAEVGTMSYDANGELQTVTGSTIGGAKADFISQTNGLAMSIDVDLSSISGIASDNNISVKTSDGFPAATLKGYSVGEGGYIMGYFSDGSIKEIAQIAVATFSNPSGLSAQGQNLYSVSASSGEPDIGPSSVGNKGTIQAGSLESSNVDTSSELTDLMFYQKAYTANSKTITISNQVLDVAISLIR